MTKDEINRLKSLLRLEEVAGRYIKLRRTGRSWTGLCPFHPDRHPSLSICPETQTYTCFSCGAKGDVFSLVQQLENCSFGEAVAKLGGVPSVKPGQTSGSRPKPCQEVSDTRQPAPPPEAFLAYLQPTVSGDSDLSDTWLEFEVARSLYQVPPAWKSMRNRLVFPIRNEEGILVGYAARRLSDTEADSPKYINSAASELYHKSDLLYGLYRAKESIRHTGYAFVTEGYKDVLAMHAAGFTNTVALCGTALCSGHIALLKKYTSQVYLLLDGDQAGREASARAAVLLGEAGMDAVICPLPEGEDPDSLFRLRGKAAFSLFVASLRQSHAPSEEELLQRRIRRGIGLLSATVEPTDRVPLLALLGSCMNRLSALSQQAARPATMDWRWKWH